jgi:AAA domain-containing protein
MAAVVSRRAVTFLSIDMIQLDPRLFVRRMIVTSAGKSAYDQTFHLGTNIIRGSNSSGKSTISDFLFFGLGGEVSRWKPEAAKCDRIFMEIAVNGTLVTVQRSVSDSSRQAMAIFWGSLESAQASAVEGWEIYPFQRSANKDSLSQALFRALGMPEVRAELSNITMHQILRLMYVDQLSSVESIMRDERFDSALTRDAVGDLLLGAYDDTIYIAELALKERQREFDDANRQRSSIRDLLTEAEQEIDANTLNGFVLETEAQLSRVRTALSERAVAASVSDGRNGDSAIKEIQGEVLATRKALSDSLADIEKSSFEIEDSKAFLLALSERMRALEESRITRKSLSALPLSQCPHCLTELSPVQNGTCVLCKEPLAAQPDNPGILRKKQELAHQIRESESLLAGKIERLVGLRRGLPIAENSAKAAQRKLDDLKTNAQSSRDTRYDDLLVQRGGLESRLIYLAQQSKAVGILVRLNVKVQSLKSEIGRLELLIKEKHAQQSRKLAEAKSRIEHYALKLLRDDLPREDVFRTASTLTVDFSRNTFAVDGRNQFSASSITYLKNCVHFGILFASLELPFMRYPRFILCDNMEDKGMEEDRSRNFQRGIVRLSQASDVEHQIVFTTSMIDPALNVPELCIGPEYSHTKKSLTIV